jgi:competence protein ComEC
VIARLLELRWPTFLVLALCAGLAVSNWLRPPTDVLAGVALCAGAAAVIAAEGYRRLAALAALLLVAGLWWGGVRLAELERSVLAGRVGDWADATVVVTGPARRTRYSVRLPAQARAFDGEPVRERVLLELPGERAPPQGAVLELRAQPVEPHGPETGFDERGWLRRSGVHVVLRGRQPRVVGRRGGIGGVADRLRVHVADTLALVGRGERRAVLAGILLGEDEGLDGDLRDDFRASGLYHLLAVSGQNVAFVALGTAGIVLVLGLGRLVGQVAAIGAVLAYALAVGWQPSVVRASVAGCLAAVACLASRPSDAWHFLALGALVLLAWTPASLHEPGFQLSFTAVAAILVVVPRLRRLHAGYPLPWGVVQVVGIAAACGAATAPVLLLQFGVVPVWTVPANALAEPAMPPLLGLGLLAAVVEPVSPSAAAALTWLAGWCAAWIAWCARQVASWPHAQTSSPLVVAAPLAVAAAAGGLSRLPSGRRRPALLCSLAFAAVLAGGWLATRSPPSWTPPSGLRVSFLDVGQGDAALLEVPQGSVLVDQGPPEARVGERLRRSGLGRLSALVLTHPQRDHIGGAPGVLDRLGVETVLHPGLAVKSADSRSALAAGREQGAAVVVARAGQVFRLGRLVLRVMWPDGPGLPSEDPNERAIVLLASYGATDVLLTADAETNVTGRLRLPPVEVLKVAHHGSEDEGLEEALTVLRPRIAVVSVGRGNDYGHPRPETVAALEAAPGLQVFRTDRDGTVVVESDGRTLTVRRSAGPRRRRPRAQPRRSRRVRLPHGRDGARARLPPDRKRPPEDRDRARPASAPFRARSGRVGRRAGDGRGRRRGAL